LLLTCTWGVTSGHRLVRQKSIANKAFIATLDSEILSAALLGDVIAEFMSHLRPTESPGRIEDSSRSRVRDAAQVYVGRFLCRGGCRDTDA
jgi:hypothetical protein